MNYFKPKSVTEAMVQLALGDAKIIAGGTDLVLDLKEGRVQVGTLVDISEIKDMQQITADGKTITIGGAVTHTQAATAPTLHIYAPALAAGCRSVGSRQIRNVATLAGNIVNAQPAADSAVPLAVMNPIFHILTAQGYRTATMAEMYAGFGKSTLDSSRELLTSITLEAEDCCEASAYERLELRKALALPMLCAAARIRLEGNIIQWARISMAPVGVGPVRAQIAEDYLSGRPFCKKVLEEAGRLALQDANPRSNLLRGSREYRLETLPVLVKRALEKAGQRVLNKQQEV